MRSGGSGRESEGDRWGKNVSKGKLRGENEN